jgi:hypothetical protein
MASQSSTPHQVSLKATLRIAAACSAVGGSGSDFAPRGGLGLVEWVNRDPAPANRPGERAAETEVHLPDRRGRERAADVSPALLRALVPAREAVLDEWPPVAVSAALAQDRLVGVKRLAVQFGDRKVAEKRADVDADDLLVPLARRLLDVEQLEVPIHELVDRRLGCVPPAGFEPATPALGERCSIP